MYVFILPVLTRFKHVALIITSVFSQEGMTHQGPKPSHCLFLGSRNQILTTGFTKTSERQYSLWDAGDLSKPLVMEKLDSSSGVLMPFWDDVTSVFYLVGKVGLK